MAKATNSKINSVTIRMYKGGTGDCFLLQFKSGATIKFNMMIDCGCIHGGAAQFNKIAADLKAKTKGKIDLLVVTHEHADHINGFDKAKLLFDEFKFKKVWFAWTEDDEDPVANDYRANRSELGLALDTAVDKLNALVDSQYYEKVLKDEFGSRLMVDGKKKFIQSLSKLNELNMLKAAKGKPLPTMVEKFKEFNIIKDDTEVELLEPGDIRSNLAGAFGLRFYILGPPRDFKLLNETEDEEDNFEQRENKSQRDFAFLSAIGATPQSNDLSKLSFEPEYELIDIQHALRKRYNEGGDWRKIDHDWLYSAGNLAMRYERSINNTSLALAIQFEASERVLLFPADAELGNWKSWHKNLKWPVKIKGEFEKKDATYFLNKTVFYKVGHHLSHNGTATHLGLDLMTSGELTAMATLDFAKINDGWLNTMPNDLLSAELIRKCKGRLFVNGDCSKILNNMKTDRVTIKKANETVMTKLHKQFKNEIFLECTIKG
jgi:hypothetical protein